MNGYNKHKDAQRISCVLKRKQKYKLKNSWIEICALIFDIIT